MNLTLQDLMLMVRSTLQNPRESARALIALNLPSQARWIGFFLTAVLSALTTAASFALLPPETKAAMGAQLPNPLASAALQAAVLLLVVLAVHRVGRWRGGRGSFAEALLLVVWLQFILLCMQAAQLVAQVLLPPLANLIGLGALLLFFWLLTNFVAELHGFRSRASVFAGIIGVTIVLALVLAFVLLPFMPAMPPGT